ncbi:MAG: MFS transporter [Acidobacteriota bacterium]|nr:MFS transporter [Blastocatellia bacterium]MDW8413300.1 MFS transporter [Acidobacteriota bacterium]
MRKLVGNSVTTRHLPSSAIILGIVSFFADLSTEMAYPILPLFFSSLGTKPAVMGLIEGIAEATASITSGISGIISDRVGKRKPLVLLGYGMTTLAKPIVALATGWPAVMFGRFLDRFGKGIRSAPKDAVLSDVSTKADRGRVFGFERMMDSLGAVAGPLIALWLFHQLHLELGTILLLTVIPSAIALILATRLAEPNTVKPSLRLTFGQMSSRFWIFIAIYALFSLGNSSNIFILLKGIDVKLSEATIIAGYTVYNVVYSGASYPAGAISDKLGRRDVLIVGFLIYAMSYLGFALASTMWHYFVLFAFYGSYAALTDGVSKAMAADIGKEATATALGTFLAVTGITKLLASVLAGLLWQGLNSNSVFYFGAATSALAAVLLFIAIRNHPDGERP